MRRPTIPVEARGIIQHEPTIYGMTAGDTPLPLEIYLPSSPFNRLVMAGLHGEEPETTVMLSRALRSIRPIDLKAAVILGANPYGLAHGTRGNKNGVDLNRNFPTKDWKPGKTLHQWDDGGKKIVALSTGSDKAPELEVQGLIAVIKKYEIEEVNSWHSPDAAVYDEDESELGAEVAEDIGVEHAKAAGNSGVGTMVRWGTENGVHIEDDEFGMNNRTEQLAQYYPTLLRLITEAPRY